MNNQFKQILIFSCMLTLLFRTQAQTIDFTKSKILCSECKDKRLLKSVSVLQEEIQKRSHIKLSLVKKWPKEETAIFVLAVESRLNKLPKVLQQQVQLMPKIGVEGYKIVVLDYLNTVLVIGNDNRGLLYGVGKLLRKMQVRPNEILVPQGLSIVTTPKYPIRGHQLGYRPKTNSYDSWTPNQFDDYIRDLAIFGANSIEIVPPHTDDDFTNVHMKIPAIEMISEQSKICDSYDMDVWMWYPNMGNNYIHRDSVKIQVAERRAVFKAVKRLDALFVPGGDPGDLSPDELFDWLKIEAEVLQKYHPNAKIWVSPQVFKPTNEWFDKFYDHVNSGYSWLGGIVFGPWIKTPIQEIRNRVNLDIPIRKYPDITHSLSSQYPIPKWDLAYATTLGRECINPRPTDEKIIHNALDEYAQGSISYSEGTNDDVNKIIWSDQDWDPETPVVETLRDYARYFINPQFTEGIAQGLLALEKNIQGPLLTNDGVLRTLSQWKTLEKEVPKEVHDNFRFQMGLIRAYFDAYQYKRLIYETELEQKTRDILGTAKYNGSLNAIKLAVATLAKANNEPIKTEWKNKCYQLADDLFKSIGAQLTIEKHNAAPGRGNFIDTIDEPLNDAMWLIDQLSGIEKIEDENQRIFKIDELLQRTDPGPGGFYDNFGTPNSWNRVVSKINRNVDPGNLASPRFSFGVGLKGEEWVHEIKAKGFDGESTPLSWMTQVTTLYNQPLEMVYDQLDPNGSYRIRIAYTGRFQSKIKLTIDSILIHDLMETGIQPIYEYEVPSSALKDGSINLKWTCDEGQRGSQVSELWLINTDNNKK